MEYLLYIAAVFVFLFFRFGPGKRLFMKNAQPKNHGTSATKKEYQPIKVQDYYRYILLEECKHSYILKTISEFCNLSGAPTYSEYIIKIAKHDKWHIIMLDDNFSFYDFHNLVSWFTGIKEKPEIPEYSFGYARHKTDNQLDYLYNLDPENEYGDTVIGGFRDEKSFSVYLPEAYEESGNLELSNHIAFGFTNTAHVISYLKLDINDIANMEFEEQIIKYYDYE